MSPIRCFLLISPRSRFSVTFTVLPRDQAGVLEPAVNIEKVDERIDDEVANPVTFDRTVALHAARAYYHRLLAAGYARLNGGDL